MDEKHYFLMVSDKQVFMLVRGGDVYVPGHIGVKDILIVGKEIVAIGQDLNVPEKLGVTVIDASGKYVFPGLIDPHVHVLGGGGEGGPATRTPEIVLSDITSSGITTVVGVLGTDNISRSVDALYAKTRGLCIEGISAYLYTGSFHYPASTITGSVKKDVAFFKEVVGVKTAISDHRDSHMTLEEFARVSSEARFGGMLGGKKGVVHVHIGDGEKGLGPIYDLLEWGNIPINQFHPTHVSRNPLLMEQGIEFVKHGGSIDLNPNPNVEDTMDIVSRLVDEKVDLTRITFSSDGNGSHCEFNEAGELTGLGVSSVSIIIETLRGIINSGILPIADLLGFFTCNPADIIGLEGKGRIDVGYDADLLMLESDLSLDSVIARGRLMVEEGKVLVKGNFEE